jgi:DNA-binding NarL/FixJ family response regulator
MDEFLRRKILELYAAGKTQRDIAATLNVAEQLVAAVLDCKI